ncbi:hypothetical protein [Clostridium sp.]|uniref:hypothetical protein n=1 Tax=Clostridium sp. TaxID=1506 RepID=UPI0039935AD8
MAKQTSKNNDFLNTYKDNTSPKVYNLLVSLMNENKEKEAKEVTRLDYLITYFNSLAKGRNKKEIKEIGESINERITSLKKKNIDISYLEEVYEKIIKENKVKL